MDPNFPFLSGAITWKFCEIDSLLQGTMEEILGKLSLLSQHFEKPAPLEAPGDGVSGDTFNGIRFVPDDLRRMAIFESLGIDDVRFQERRKR